MIAALAIPEFLGCAKESAERTTPAPLSEGFIACADGTRLYYRKVGDGPQSLIPVLGAIDVFLRGTWPTTAEHVTQLERPAAN